MRPLMGRRRLILQIKILVVLHCLCNEGAMLFGEKIHDAIATNYDQKQVLPRAFNLIIGCSLVVFY